MGKKNRSKKFEREEKSKVKLKKKQLLPKGQNVTDTTFKVKKIVIREQLKAPSSEEPLSSRKLNVKELLSRLQHHNSSMRQDAIRGLAELVANFSSEVLDGVHLPQVIENVTRLSLECESAVRREAVKLLGSIFKKVDEVHILPLMNVLFSYMCCAMTHINHAIQEDSLLLLDAVLDSYPKLMAHHIHTVLPKFFDMISRLRSDSKPGRMLTVNLGSRLTSVRWRIQVLTRLHKLMSSLSAAVDTGFKDACRTVSVKSEQQHVPLFEGDVNSVCDLPNILQHGSDSSSTTTDEKEVLQNYVITLVPLLFETWVEVAPAGYGDDDNSLGEENAALLQCILGIMSYMWKYLKNWEATQLESETLTLLFRQQSSSDFRQHLMSGFPYSINKLPSSDKREQREHRRNMQLLTKSGVPAALDADCVQQNLALCYLACCLLQPVDSQVSEMVLQYVRKCLESRTVDDAELLPVVRELLLGEAKTWSGVPELLNVVVAVIGGRAKLIHVLCELLSRSEISYWQRSPSFKKWIGLLPDELCKEHVPYKVVQAVHQLLSQKNVLLLEQLCHKIHKIIDNLAYITITGTENTLEAKKCLGNSVYWVMNHDRRVAPVIQKHIQNDKLDKELKVHIAQILDLYN
ncbi:testis-expressed protein 10 homolog [Schistocerca piceifrons]|uniref:testis-expressed protein 10 homolog n=1 Tax=Schistocerca piceifrons TaxID=274613 RepID=UPI001F5F42AF|nr:testis-expressed protein 10 homolog [Schistocerca piceifrons]